MKTLVVRHEMDVDETLDGDAYEWFVRTLNQPWKGEVPEYPIAFRGEQIGVSRVRVIES